MLDPEVLEQLTHFEHPQKKLVMRDVLNIHGFIETTIASTNQLQACSSPSPPSTSRQKPVDPRSAGAQGLLGNQAIKRPIATPDYCDSTFNTRKLSSSNISASPDSAAPSHPQAVAPRPSLIPGRVLCECLCGRPVARGQADIAPIANQNKRTPPLELLWRCLTLCRYTPIVYCHARDGPNSPQSTFNCFGETLCDNFTETRDDDSFSNSL